MIYIPQRKRVCPKVVKMQCAEVEREREKLRECGAAKCKSKEAGREQRRECVCV